MKILRGAKARIPQMKALWLEAFPQDAEFVDVFFDRFYCPTKTLLRYDGQTLVSMLFWMDIKFKYRRRVYKGAYLYGVATKLTERNAGHFSALHETLVKKLEKGEYKFIVAIPETEGLFSLYRKLGYTSPFRRTEYLMSSLDLDEISAEEAWERRYGAYKRIKKGAFLLETRDMFLETVRDHRFLGFENGYFAFAKKDGRYIMYDVCDPDGKAPSYELEHYERSAVLLDLGIGLDSEFAEREKPVLNYLMS